MIKKERVAPVALMFIAAGISFLVCEEISRRSPGTEQTFIQQAPQAAIAQPAQSPPLAKLSLARLTSMEQPHNFAQRIAQRISHAVHSQADSAELMETSVQREDGLKTVQPESNSAAELGDVASARGPLDLSLVPGVIVLPKTQEPLASAGLYDKRTHKQM